MVMFEDESIVQPKESEWFGYFKDGQDKEMVSLQDSRLYKEVNFSKLKCIYFTQTEHLLFFCVFRIGLV